MMTEWEERRRQYEKELLAYRQKSRFAVSDTITAPEDTAPYRITVQAIGKEKTPVEDALIRLTKTEGNELLLEAVRVTGQDGKTPVLALPAGEYRAAVSAEGYFPCTVAFSATEDMTVTVPLTEAPEWTLSEQEDWG